MFKNIGMLAELTKQPFGTVEPQVFPKAYAVESAPFTTEKAQKLYASDAFRVGEFEPGHNQMHLVLDERLVPPPSVATLSSADAAVQQGATRVFHSLQRHLPEAALACQQVANAVGEPVHVNAYWSQPGTQQYPLHAEVETVLAVQLSGSKIWPIFKPLASRAEDIVTYWTRTDGKAQDIAPPPTADYLLELTPGDVLLMPRGHGHYAIAGPEGSLHLSFCILHPEIDASIIAQQHAIHPA